MSVIIIPRKHLTQPQGRFALDLSGPFSGGLGFAETPTGESGGFARVGTVGNVINGGLVGYGLNGSTYLRNSASPVRNYPLTFMALVRRTAGTLGAVMSIGSGVQRHLLYYLGDGRLRMFSGAGSTSETTAGSAGNSGELEWIAGRVSAANSRDVWLNGTLLGSDTGNIVTTEAATAAIGTYWNSDAPALTFTGEIYLACAWSRALPEAELRELYLSPWQLFRAEPLRIYSLPSGGIPTSIAVAASNITSSGARITATLSF